MDIGQSRKIFGYRMDSRPPLATGSRMRRTRCSHHFDGSSFGAEGTYGSEVERIDPDVARRRLVELDWWHTIEIAPGVVTPGGWDLRASAARLPWPPSLHG